MNLETQMTKSGIRFENLNGELTIEMVLGKSREILRERLSDSDEHLQSLVDVYVSRNIFQSLLNQVMKLAGLFSYNGETIRRSPLGYKYFVFNDLCILDALDVDGLCLIVDPSDFGLDHHINNYVAMHPSWHFAWKNCRPAIAIDYQI